MKIYPVPGRRVRDPVTFDILPAAGRDVPETMFWTRLLVDGDVTLTAPKAVVVDEPVEVAEPVVAASKRRG